MTMQSSDLLPVLQELPGGEPGQHRSFREHITDIVSMDRGMSAAEFASAVSIGMWPVFGIASRAAESRSEAVLGIDFRETGINDSYLQAAYERTSFFDPDTNVIGWWESAQAGGAEASKEFAFLKGIFLEFKARDHFNQHGYTLELADDSFQEGWDLHGTNPNGEYVQIQVKAGDSQAQIDKTIEAMQETDYPFAVGSDIHDGISEKAPELVDRIVADMGPNHELVTGIEDGLNTLSDSMGVDVPDGVVDIIPYAAAIVAGARLVHSVIKTEKEFKAADRTTRNKIQVVQSLTVMSRANAF